MITRAQEGSINMAALCGIRRAPNHVKIVGLFTSFSRQVIHCIKMSSKNVEFLYPHVDDVDDVDDLKNKRKGGKQLFIICIM